MSGVFRLVQEEKGARTERAEKADVDSVKGGFLLMKEETVNGNLALELEVLEGCDKEPEL